VFNDPVNLVDPWGHNAGTLLGAEIGSALGPIGALIGAAAGTAIVYIGGKALYDWWGSSNGNVCYYEPAPDDINDIFPNAERVKRKSQRRRWKDKKTGDIYEWDYQHGEIEIYNKRGKHKGSLNPKTGKKKPAVPGRRIEP